MKNTIAEFQNPGSQYRGKPFWAWNGKLDTAELRRQVRVMKQMGLGGFFMHARIGLVTPYLSKEWFDCVEACVDEARKLGMEAWLYDEDCWPSGTAGGLVTRNPKYTRRILLAEEFDDPAQLAWNESTIAAFTARIEGGNAWAVRPLARGTRPGRLDGGRSLIVFRRTQEEPSNGFSHKANVDTMNHEAIREFIRVTHEAYRQRCGSEFGKTVPGIFTDEPERGSVASRGTGAIFPWTDKLPAVFRKRYGYDIRPRLMELLYDVDCKEVSQARWHYYDCTTHLFVDAFARQIGEWCAKNKILFTGHILSEETLLTQTAWVGSCMRFYEHMQAPGVDLLTERWRLYDAAKQVSSAARQFGAKWRLTETLGCTGWDFPFDGHKGVGDWQLALGINLRCQHLYWYTMEAEGKRDYPGAIGHQATWWPFYPVVEDYFARVQAVMTRGTEVRDLLVIHPVESMWLKANVKKGWPTDTESVAYSDIVIHMSDTLLSAHLDFDYGDEELLSRHARVGRQAGRPVVRVGKAVYTVVLVPPLVSMRSSTLALLRPFKENGGQVIFAGDPPKYVDALPSDEPARLAVHCPKAPARGPGLVAAVNTSRRVSIVDAAGAEIHCALYLLREDKDAFYLFVCNTGHSKSQFKTWATVPDRNGHMMPLDVMVRDRREEFPEVTVALDADAEGAPEEWDPTTGKRFSAVAKRTAAGWKIATGLPRLGSRLFVFPKKKRSRLLARRPVCRPSRVRKLRYPSWDALLSEPNVLVLERPRYRVGNGPWRGPEEILRLDRAVRKQIGGRGRGSAVQPWAPQQPKPSGSMPVELEYVFDATAVPSAEISLGMEHPERYRIDLNGKPLSCDDEYGWWCDRSLRRVSFDPSLLRLRRNRLRLRCDYGEADSLETIYLLGSFGVKLCGIDPVMTPRPPSLRIGDWVKQGLPFYSGSVTYCRTVPVPRLRRGEHLFVRVPAYRGTALRVLVDGREAGMIAWEPNEVDVTGFMEGKKAVDLRIEVIGHRRNSHGPFHYHEKWPEAHGSGLYVGNWVEKRWHDGFQLVPCGLMEAPELVLMREL